MFPRAASAGDIVFSPTITQEQFRLFSGVMSQAIFSNPVGPPQGAGLIRFDAGVAAVVIPVDEDAAYWQASTSGDLATQGYLAVPRVIVSKGIGLGGIAGSYAKVPDSDIEVYGGALDFPLIRGGALTPALVVRGSYSQLRGAENLDLSNAGAEVFLSKGFGPVTPYGGVGIYRTKSSGRVAAVGNLPERTLDEEFDEKRYTLGVRISMLIPRLVLEATQAEERSYAAKLSFGF